MESLAQSTRITRVLDAKAAGTTNQNGTAVDMQTYEGVLFVAAFGALTATQVTALKAQQCPTSDGTFSDLEDTKVGPLEDDDDNQLLVLDVKNPLERYVRCVIDRETADAVIDGVIAIQYGPRKKPTSHGSTVSAAEHHTSPAEGTA